jgi:hypothetical protein
MTRRFSTAFLLVLGALFHASAASAAVFLVPDDRTMIREADGIVMGLVVGQEPALEANNDIVTVTHLAPEQVFKGTISMEAPVMVRDLGGIFGNRAMGVSGGVTYEQGERVLLFLDQKEDGSWTTYGLSLGKLRSMRTPDGERLLLRDMSASAIGLSPDGHSEHVEIPRSEDAFLGYIRAVIARDNVKDRLSGAPFRDGIDRRGTSSSGGANGSDEIEANYFVAAPASEGSLTPVTTSTLDPVTNATYPPSAYTQGTFRWTEFDAGKSVTYYSSGTQGSYDVVGVAQKALAAWTNDAGSNVSLVYGGTKTNRFVEDGVNTIVYNSSTDVPSGAIGYAKWYANAQHTYKGETFYSISEGDVVIKAGISVSNAVFQEAVTHEVGHTLGFRHSDQGTPASNAAAMRSVVTGVYGTTLGPWDVEAVRTVYTSTVVTPPPCTAPAITTQPASRTVNAGTSVTLTVVATGTAPLVYQWYIGSTGSTGSPIAGAAGSSLTVTPSTTTSYWVRVTNACGTANSATATITVNIAAPAPGGTSRTRGDMNYDARADIVWRNYSTGANRFWYMNGTTVTGVANIPSRTDTNWHIAGTGDFNGDDRQDLVWRNVATGANEVWYMNGTTVLGSAAIRSVPTDWDLTSVFEYGLTPTSDILWYNRATRQAVMFFMNGTAVSSSTTLPSANVGWKLSGTGDFNRDQWNDMVWHNQTTGEVVIWFLVGTNRASTTSFGPVTPDWTVGSIGDYDRNGFPDIVWRNTITGANMVMYTAGGVRGPTASLPTEGDLNWEMDGPR